MPYHFYLMEMEMPNLPEEFSKKIKSKNKTEDLLDGRTINFLKSAGLTDIPVTLVFPMIGGAHSPDFYIAALERYKKQKQPTQAIMTRTTPDGKPLFFDNIKVAIEDYTVSEKAGSKEGLDVTVSINLREYVDYGTETVKIKKIGGQTVASITKERETSKAPKASSYTTKEGDTLWSIASKYLGDGARAKELFATNQDMMTDPNILKAGTKLRIPS